MTSERVCGTHPSERSPRTAAQAGADGDSLHICTGGESARATLAAARPQAAPNKTNPHDHKFRMSANSFTWFRNFLGLHHPAAFLDILCI
jgi:hypothetical protein